MPPVFFFVIDVSVTAINSGMVDTACAAIKESLDRLPGGDRTRIGFLTFDSNLHFYNLKSSLSQPQMMVHTSSCFSHFVTPLALFLAFKYAAQVLIFTPSDLLRTIQILVSESKSILPAFYGGSFCLASLNFQESLTSVDII